MEVDEATLDNVVDVATSGILKDIQGPAKQQRVPSILPPMDPFVRLYVDMDGDGPLSQDSLSFPIFAATEEVIALKNANNALRLRISALVETYYQWKVAIIFSVNRSDQIAIEFKKIDNEYLHHNLRWDFGLTS